MKLIVANFKMNLLSDEIDNYLKEITKYHFNNVVFCPSYIYLQKFIDNNLIVGSQDVSMHEKGTFTGDVSILQLKSIGVKYAIIGHSERRNLYNDNKFVNNKIKKCLDNDVVPILCIGESLEEYKSNKTFDVLAKQIDEAFTDLQNINDVIIAYEPIYAIGSGIVPSNRVIYEAIEYIKKYVLDKYKINIKVLYGGSVNNENITNLETIDNIDGYLIGGCSIKVYDFIDLIKKVNG